MSDFEEVAAAAMSHDQAGRDHIITTQKHCDGKFFRGRKLRRNLRDKSGVARIGATRTAATIASYFSGTATDRGLVRDGRLVATGETLAQVQARVLGTGTVVPLFTNTPGFVVFGARAGLPIGI